MVKIYILIILLHGWGAGFGSNGNAVSMAEFRTQEKCEVAASVVMKHSPNNAFAICVEK